MRALVGIQVVCNPEENLWVEGLQIVSDVEDKIVNDFDFIGLEGVLKLKDAGEVDEVVVFGIGSYSRLEAVMRKALGMGADRGFIFERSEDLLDAYSVAFYFKRMLENLGGAEIIMLGKMGVNYESQSVASMLGGMLGHFPVQNAYAMSIENGGLRVSSEGDRCHRHFRTEFPAIVSADLRMGEPRFVSLPQLIRAKKKPLEVVDLGESSMRVRGVGYRLVEEVRGVSVQMLGFEEGVQRVIDLSKSSVGGDCDDDISIGCNEVGDVLLFVEDGVIESGQFQRLYAAASEVSVMLGGQLRVIHLGKAGIEEAFGVMCRIIGDGGVRCVLSKDSELFIKIMPMLSVVFGGHMVMRACGVRVCGGELWWERRVCSGRVLEEVIGVEGLGFVSLDLSSWGGRSGGIDAKVWECKGEFGHILFPSVVDVDWYVEDGQFLESATVVFGGGRGLGVEGFNLMREIARKLGVAVGGSRAAVDLGYMRDDRQIGQSGKSLVASVYVCLGISGSVQHLAGIRQVKCVVAVNHDPDAAIFRFADYGVVCDAGEFLTAVYHHLVAG